MNRRFVAFTVVCMLSAGAASAQTSLVEASRRARELIAQAREAEDSVPASWATAASADVPGVREEVRSLEVSVSRTCVGNGPRYALYPITAGMGPALSATAASLQSSYLYPLENGLSLSLSGDGPGAALAITSADGAASVLGTIIPEEGPCREYPAATARIALASGVSAALLVQPRTGILRPACYKDIINGYYKLDTWTVLTLSSSGQTMMVRTKDSAAFRDEGACRAYYARLTAS